MNVLPRGARHPANGERGPIHRWMNPHTLAVSCGDTSICACAPTVRRRAPRAALQYPPVDRPREGRSGRIGLQSRGTWGRARAVHVRLPDRALRHRARPCPPLPHRVRGGRAPISGAGRRARARACPAAAGSDDVHAVAQRLPPPLLGPLADARVLDRRPAGRRPHRRPATGGSAADHHAGLVHPVGALPVDRQHRWLVLRLRLGIIAARGGVPGHLPGQRPDGPAAADHHRLPLAGVPRRVRSRADQAAR